MTISPRMTLMIAIAALVVCGALAWLQRTTEVRPRGSLVVRLYPPYVHQTGLAWQAEHMLPFDLKSLLPYADDPADAQGHSPVIVYEEGRPLGPPHSTFADISQLGHGRFTWWIGQGLFFSTSDGSDPNRNGRRYWAVVP